MRASEIYLNNNVYEACAGNKLIPQQYLVEDNEDDKIVQIFSSAK